VSIPVVVASITSPNELLYSFVLASTQELHEKISQLANRVRELEDALRSSHAQQSSDIHPLLTEELLQIKAPLQRELPNKNGALITLKEEESNPDIVDAFGSLSISLSGRTKYYGHIANSYVRSLTSVGLALLLIFGSSTFSRSVEPVHRAGLTFLFLIQNEFPEGEEPDDQLARLESILPPDILRRSASIPIASPSHSSPHPDTVVRDLLWYFPPPNKAAELRSIYFRHAAWMYVPRLVSSTNPN
jgi:Mg2+ and Co2+ transporter CorA